MPVRLVLRNTGNFSPYRELLKWLIESPSSNSLLICSGYIQEEANYSVLEDGLLQSIRNGCEGGIVKTIAGKLDDKWEAYYKSFITKLTRANVNVDPYIAPEKNWHAKIAIKLINDRPIVALIGSSNLTRPAFSRQVKYWNFEGDVLIWLDHEDLNQYFRRRFNPPMRHGDIFLVFDPEAEQPREKEQLDSLYQDIIKSKLNHYKS